MFYDTSLNRLTGFAKGCVAHAALRE